MRVDAVGLRGWCIALLLATCGWLEPAWAQKCLAPGFRVELLYQAPEIEHPSVVACDDQGNLFVGEDPMDMRGPSTKEFDRILYLQFDENGAVKRKTVFAENLSAVFGLIWRDGALYVMHAPHYSMFQDTDGDGVADVRKDLAHGFGPPAGVYGFNDHIVTGTRLGLDGRVYVSVGDKGIPRATGSDGSTISLEGGGVVRMNLDGSELEIVSAGTRNHLDVAMDSLDNIFTYDNTDDGLGWWTRFTHHVETGYYGYPYDYHPHPERHLPRISEHGGGSPVGGACYREGAWPARYQDAVFFCEWGKRKVQVFFPKREGASFTAEMEDFLVPDDQDEFRPLDLCFSPDGKHMYLADWNFGGWVNPQVAGRLYRITYVGNEGPQEPQPLVGEEAPLAEQVKALAHRSHAERLRAQDRLVRFGREAIEPVAAVLADSNASQPAKIHALWALAGIARRIGDYDPAPVLLKTLEDKDSDVRAQAARALGQLRASSVWSVFSTSGVERRSVSTSTAWTIPNDQVAAKLIAALADEDAAVRLQAAVALGRLGDKAAAEPLVKALHETDVYARFTMIQAIRALNHWEPALAAVQGDNAELAAAVVLAATSVYDEQAVDLLVKASQSPRPELAAAAIAALAEVHRKADPYEKGWWGTQPAKGKPAREKKHAWAGTETVLAALKGALTHPADESRIAAARAQQQVRDPDALELVRRLAADDPSEAVRAEVMRLLAETKDEASVDTLAALAADASRGVSLRTQAVETLQAIGSTKAVEPLAQLASDDATPTTVLAAALKALGSLKAAAGRNAVESRLTHADAAVRTEAVEALGAIAGKDAAARLVERLTDEAAPVRAAALRTLAAIGAKEAVPQMLSLATDDEVRREALLALAALPDPRALTAYLRGLTDANPEVRSACGAAVNQIRGAVASDIIELHKRNELSPETRRELGLLFAAPTPIRQWQLLGGWSKEGDQPSFDTSGPADLGQTITLGDRQLAWQSVTALDERGQVDPSQLVKPTSQCWAMAYAAYESSHEGILNWMLGSDDQAILWINGEKVYEFLGDRAWAPDQAKGTVKLRQGVNHIWLQTGNTGGGWQFSLAVGGPDPQFAFLYEDVPPQLDLAAFRKHAARGGNAARGEQLFFDVNGVGCVKCHAVGDKGTATVGPNLLGVGAKYPREELIRSVLEPSSRILSGYELTTVVSVDGRQFQGVVQTENDEFLELADTEGRVTRLPRSEIDEVVRSNLSAMPNGLEKGLTLEDFADIVAYLESLKQTPGK